MKKNLLLLSFLIFSAGLMAQCDELFISEYLEGYASNKALEIYNPTSSAIQLSGYSLARFSNGSTTLGDQKIIQLPEHMLEPYDVFVVVLDKRDTTLWDSDLDKPIWNGYNLIDTLFDAVTGLPIIDSATNMVITGPQYLDGAALFGNEYNEEYDLECKGDAFLNPVYNTNNVMYFNGNDAVALMKGTELLPDGSNLVDVIGVIGEDPESTLDEPAWVDENGFWLTRDRTLVRMSSVTSGRNNPTDIIFPNGTFTGQEWLSYPKNEFSYLGVHNSTCATGTQYDQYSCISGPISSTYQVNQIAFRMYPNPNDIGVLTVEAAEQIERVEIYNLVGQRMYTEKIGGAEKIEVTTNQLTKGMYLVNLFFADNQLSIQKLIVE